MAELAAELTDTRAICTLRLFARSIGLEACLPPATPEVVEELRNTYGVTEPAPSEGVQ